MKTKQKREDFELHIRIQPDSTWEIKKYSPTEEGDLLFDMTQLFVAEKLLKLLSEDLSTRTNNLIMPEHNTDNNKNNQQKKA